MCIIISRSIFDLIIDELKNKINNTTINISSLDLDKFVPEEINNYYALKLANVWRFTNKNTNNL